jgi:hypothetical protein
MFQHRYTYPTVIDARLDYLRDLQRVSRATLAQVASQSQ